MREHMFTVRFSEEEWQRAVRLTEHHGINVASLFRMLMKKEERECSLEEARPAKHAGS